MYISTIRIKNFRIFGDPPFAMNLRPFTLILGENNIGKTNLLTAIALLFSQEISTIQRRNLEVEDINYLAVLKFKREVADETRAPDSVSFPEVEITATLSDIKDDQHPVVGDWYSNSKLTQGSVTFKYSLRGNFKINKWIEQQRAEIALRRKEEKKEKDERGDTKDYGIYVDFPIAEYRYTIYGGGRPSNECEAWLLGMLRVDILDALRDADRELSAGGDRGLLYRVLRQNNKSRYTDVKRLLEDLEDAIRLDQSLSDIRSDVQNLLQRISLHTPGEDHSIGLHFVALETSEILRKIGITYGTNPVPISRNGLGRNNLLYVALVLSQLAKAPDLLAGEESYVCFRLVGIEEPEAHLHPHLEDHLARNIESIRAEYADNLQLILTSHSTHLPAKLALENTAVLFRNTTDKAIAAHYVLSGIDAIKEKETVRFLSLYLDATRSRLLFARRIILVEGISECVIVAKLFEQEFGKSIETFGASVINVNGLAFKHFLKIVSHGFFKKCAVLTDSDAGTRTEDRAPALRKDFKSTPQISVEVTSLSTFEKDLISSNCSGESKELLLETLARTKPKNGPKFKAATGQSDIDIDAFFSEIAAYKSEFAFNLVAVLNDEVNEVVSENVKEGADAKTPRKLMVPDYISRAFNFIQEE